MSHIYKPSIGSISHGTMRPEDLIPCFAAELEACVKSSGAHTGRTNLYLEAREITDFDSEEASEVLSDLFDALNEYAPEGTYFGAHEGDGSDYGFWPVEDN